MIYSNITNEELLRHVEALPAPSPLEKELAQRLAEVTGEVGMLNHLINEARHRYDQLNRFDPHSV